MKTYRISLTFQNPYIGSRNGGNRVISTGLSMGEARKKLLSLYNEQYSDERPYASNWGLAVIQSSPFVFGASKTLSDGTRSFDWDGRTYSIEEEKED